MFVHDRMGSEPRPENGDVSVRSQEMTEADDAAVEQAHGFTQIGRWHDIANGRGVAIVEAASSRRSMVF